MWDSRFIETPNLLGCPNSDAEGNTVDPSARLSSRHYTFVGFVFSGVFDSVVPISPMKHKEIRWNPHTEEWFCVVCGRTSDHVSEADARTEIEVYECQLPARIVGQ